MNKVISTERLPIKLWLDDIESGALAQAKDLANLFYAWKWISIMPDSHQGYGMPISGVMATQGVIVPNAVGVDIGCGMIATKTTLKETEITVEAVKEIMGKIRDCIPVGFNHNKEAQPWEGFDDAPDVQIVQQELKSARNQLGTLGGGNHFIELQRSDDGHIWLMIHSGSRNFGYKTAKEYHNKAKKLCERWKSDIPNNDLSFLPMETKDGKDYYEAMKYCLRFAEASRALMMEKAMMVVKIVTGAEKESEVNIHHNYAAFENHYGKNVLIHRKGATKATVGLEGIIPGSMGTSSYIVEGLGNPESFMSCSHGAGRTMSRSEARGKKKTDRSLDLKTELKRMEGVVHGLRNAKDLDEAPGAYKDIDVVMENQKDLVKVVVKLKPVGNIKG